MKRHVPATLRNHWTAKALISALLILFSASLFSASLAAQGVPGAQGDIVRELMPDDAPLHAPRLTPAEKSQAVKRLEAAQRQATGERAQQIAFLLAALGSNYSKNRDYLVRALHRCYHATAKSNCDEETGGFLVALYKSGHDELLPPLLAAWVTDHAALLELLGDFYSDVLTEEPAKFLRSLEPFPIATQNSICGLAGAGDGGGIAQETLQKARKRLKAVGSEVALRCLRQVEKANVHRSAD
jgi:hypothetical protein